MTNEKHDPWALLREARDWVGGWSGILPMAGKDIDALRARIDAALAEPLDSAQSAVESDDPWWTPSSHRAQERKCDLHVWRMSLKEWGWSTTIYREHERGREDLGSGVCLTLDEAQRAALAAARGMK
jgi:hypothetical protein